MKPEDILQTCLADVLSGQKTPAECATRYPQSPDMKAYLSAALALQAVQHASLSPAAEQAIEARLRRRMRELPAAPRPRALAGWRAARLRWVTVSALVGTLLLAGVGTTAAASASNPGDLLYGVKRADESAQVFFSPASERGFVYIGLARHRLDEITALSQRSHLDSKTVSHLSDDLAAHTTAALAFVDVTPADRQAELLNSLVEVTNAEQATLVALQPGVPPEARPGLDRAIEATSRDHVLAVERLALVLAAHRPANSTTPAGSAPIASATLIRAEQTRVPPDETDTAEPSATPTPTGTPETADNAKATPHQTHNPPGQTQVPPGQTKVPPGQTKVPPGLTHIPPGQTQVPPGQTHIPPGQTQVPPGQTQAPPGPTKKAHG